MYAEIDAWNQSGKQIIRCACLYRWPKYDAYAIDGKANVIADWKRAQAQGYRWDTAEPEPPDPDTCLWDEQRIAQIEARLDEIERRMAAAGRELGA